MPFFLGECKFLSFTGTFQGKYWISKQCKLHIRLLSRKSRFLSFWAVELCRKTTLRQLLNVDIHSCELNQQRKHEFIWVISATPIFPKEQCHERQQLVADYWRSQLDNTNNYLQWEWRNRYVTRIKGLRRDRRGRSDGCNEKGTSMLKLRCKTEHL